MYVEMIDETGQVSEAIKKQTLDLLQFAAEKTGKDNKEMAVTFVTNERSHELNLEYRDTDRPTDVISLEYKPESSLSFSEEDLEENPELAEMLDEFDAYIGELLSLSQLIMRKCKQKNMDIHLNVKWASLQYMVFYISMVMIITPLKKKKKCLLYRKRF